MNTHYLFDIDSTFTEYSQTMPEETVCGNFLLPVIVRFAETKGISSMESVRKCSAVIERKTEWDYPDFIAELGLSLQEIIPVLREFHSKFLTVHDDTVRLVRFLIEQGAPVSVISNNPHLGCLLKLERCGLADSLHDRSVFSMILSTELMHGCKGNGNSWKNALDALYKTAGPCRIRMIGDNLYEDGVLAIRNGVEQSFILNRRNYEPIPGCILFDDADRIIEYLKKEPQNI